MVYMHDGEEPLSNITLPWGKAKKHVDLDSLTPMARALAEAMASSAVRWISIRSRRMVRDLHPPGQAEQLWGAAHPGLDEPRVEPYESWSIPREGWTIEEWLEYEARKMPGWYPVAPGGGDLPSSPAARLDDGITADQCLLMLAMIGCTVDKDRWMRKATKGADGFPAVARHNGHGSLWSEAEVRAWAIRRLSDPLGQLSATATGRRQDYETAMDELRRAVVEEAAKGATDSALARRAGVDRMTILRWLGKR